MAGRTARQSVRILGGYFVFGSEDSGLLVSLLPEQVHVRGVERLSTLVKLLIDEAALERSGRDTGAHSARRDIAGRSVAADANARRPCGIATRSRRRPAGGSHQTDAYRSRAVPGRWLISRKRRRCPAPRSSTVFAQCRRAANGISAGMAHGARKGPSAPARSISRRWPNASATDRQARSVRLSAATWASRPADMLAAPRTTIRQVPSFVLCLAGKSVQNQCIQNGAPDRIRTCDLCLRRAALYPSELRVPA